MRALLPALIAICACGALEAAVHYVAPEDKGGSDEERVPGTKEAPFATLDRALRAATAGDTVIMRGGSYAANVNISVDSVMITAETGEKPVIALRNGPDNPAIALQVNSRAVLISGIEIKGGEHGIMVHGERCIIDQCRIHDVGMQAVKFGANAHEGRVSRCELFSAGRKDSARGAAIVVAGAIGVAVQDCWCHENGAEGIVLFAGSNNCTIERCFISDCRQNGISLCYSGAPAAEQGFTLRNTLVRNNYLKDIAGAAFSCWGTFKTRFTGNTVLNGGESYHGALWLGSVQLEGKPVANAELVVANNIVLMSRESKGSAVEIGEHGVTPDLVLNGNRYHRIGSDPMFESANHSAKPMDFATWREGTKYDEKSSLGDPQLDANYHLAKGSPCIDAGVPIENCADDYDGGLRERKKPDIGADEFEAGAPLFVPPREGTIGTGGGSSGRRNLPEKERSPWLEKVLDGLQIKAKAERQKITKAALDAWKNALEEDERFAVTYAKIKDDRDLLATAREDYRKKLSAIWEVCDSELARKKLLSGDQLDLWKNATRCLRE